jgi:hypothetical protein
MADSADWFADYTERCHIEGYPLKRAYIWLIAPVIVTQCMSLKLIAS